MAPSSRMRTWWEEQRLGIGGSTHERGPDAAPRNLASRCCLLGVKYTLATECLHMLTLVQVAPHLDQVVSHILCHVSFQTASLGAWGEIWAARTELEWSTGRL